MDDEKNQAAPERQTADQTKKKKPSMALNAVISLVLVAICVQHFVEGRIGFGLFFLALACFNGFIAYRAWQARK